MGVGQTEGGAINDFGAQAMPELSRLFARSGHGHTQAAKEVQRESPPGLAISAVTFIDVPLVVEGEKGLNLPDNFAASESECTWLIGAEGDRSTCRCPTTI